MLLVLSVIWGSAFMLVKVVLEEVPPLTLVAGRLAGACLFLLLALLVTGRSLPRDRNAWSAFAFLGIVNNIFPFTLLTWGQQHVESSLAAILVASMPLSTVVLAHVWIDERLTVDRALGILVGLGGVFLLIGADLRDLTESSTLGQLAIVGGVVGYSTGTVFVRRYLRNADPTATAAGQTLVGAAMMAPIALAVDTPFDLSISVKAALAWATLGALSSAVEFTNINFMNFATGGVTSISTANFTSVTGATRFSLGTVSSVGNFNIQIDLNNNNQIQRAESFVFLNN